MSNHVVCHTALTGGMTHRRVHDVMLYFPLNMYKWLHLFTHLHTAIWHIHHNTLYGQLFNNKRKYKTYIRSKMFV